MKSHFLSSKSIRSFIGAKDFDQSRKFYHQLGFEEIPLGPNMSYFKISPSIGFYLQNSYVKDWVENSMLFLEVDDIDDCWQQISKLKLQDQYKYVKLSHIKTLDWGREFFLHDPSQILWHIGCFKS